MWTLRERVQTVVRGSRIRGTDEIGVSDLIHTVANRERPGGDRAVGRSRVTQSEFRFC